MAAAPPRRFRDSFQEYVPVWLKDRPGLTSGYRFLWSLIAPWDSAIDVLIQGVTAAWPGEGTPSALPYIGRARGLIRGQADTDETFSEKLRGWLDTWRDAGSATTLGRQIHNYLGNSPRVRIVNRAGQWVTIEANGTVTENQQAWDWDSVSHPERAGYWSELWVIVYPTEWSIAGTFGDGGTYNEDEPSGIGHDVTRVEFDAIRGLVAQWKSAHSKCRAIIFTSDASLFDPTTPASLPNGNWGSWGSTGSGPRVLSDRNVTTCRYWELP